MAFKALARYALGAVSAGALLAGCSAGSSQSFAGAVPTTRQQASREPRFDAQMFAQTNRAHEVPQQHLNHAKSWMLPDAGKQ